MKLILLFLLCLSSTIAIAKQQIETIQLNHQLASQVLPQIQPFLPEKATASAYSDLIIIKAEPSEIREIKQLIDRLDTPVQRLKVSVLQTDEILDKQKGNHLSADININEDSVSGGVSANRWSTQQARNKEHSYQAQGIAGKPIRIMMGQTIPQKNQYLVLRSDGDLAIQSNTSYIDLNNGFQAVARVLPNNQVMIDIHPSFARLNSHGTIDSSTIVSSVSGPANTWIELGQIDNEKNLKKQNATSYHSHRQQQQTIYIKVEQL
jgi:hypothetical protein